LGFTLLVDFLAVAGLPEHVEVHKTELKPFLAILGTRMRARRAFFLVDRNTLGRQTLQMGYSQTSVY
jgi:hypothetical protein